MMVQDTVVRGEHAHERERVCGFGCSYNLVEEDKVQQKRVMTSMKMVNGNYVASALLLRVYSLFASRLPSGKSILIVWNMLKDKYFAVSSEATDN